PLLAGTLKSAPCCLTIESYPDLLSRPDSTETVDQMYVTATRLCVAEDLVEAGKIPSRKLNWRGLEPGHSRLMGPAHRPAHEPAHHDFPPSSTHPLTSALQATPQSFHQ